MFFLRTKSYFETHAIAEDELFFNKINEVIKNNADAKIDVKDEIGSEMIDVLDELHYIYYTSFGKDAIKDGYEQSRKWLGFTLID